MVKLIIGITLIFCISCKEKIAPKYPTSEKSIFINDDKILNSNSENTYLIAKKIFNERNLTVNDSIFLETVLDDVKIQEIDSSQNSIIFNLDFCLSYNDIVNNELDKELTFLLKSDFLVDGGETEIFKYYYYNSNVLVFEFIKPNNIASIHPKCNYSKKEITEFLRQVSIFEIEYFKNNLSSLNSNSVKEELLIKLDTYK